MPAPNFGNRRTMSMSAQDRMDPALKGVIWTRTSKEARRERAALDDDLDVDLAIVGGGFCGLSAALHAAASGLSVAVVEAGIVGGGPPGPHRGLGRAPFPPPDPPRGRGAPLCGAKGAP